MNNSKKAIIIFHSVGGNTFLLAQKFLTAFQQLNIETKLVKVHDENFKHFADILHTPKKLQEEILQIPTITDCHELLDYDYIIMGSPTYFGNVSGAMKCFIDSFSPLFMESKLFGKKFTSFATASTPTGGSDMCLLALNNFAMHMGMTITSIPANVAGVSQPAYGFSHFTGGNGELQPNEQTQAAINDFAARLIKL